jgi:NADH-quinone oxidoreductase subunit F
VAASGRDRNESLANVPPILEHGPDWYKAIGTEKSPGTKIICVSGHVERPGNYEVPLGTPFAEVLAMAGGVWQGRSMKALLPAGASAPVLTADVAMGMNCDWESVAATGSILGSASFIVLDETTDMAWVAYKTVRFFQHESCGKCSPCREGTFWMKRVLTRVVAGQAEAADIPLLGDVVRQIDSKCFCPLGEFALSAPRSTLAQFEADYRGHVAEAAPRR